MTFRELLKRVGGQAAANSPVLLKLGDEALIKVVVLLFFGIWNEEGIPKSWSESGILLWFRKKRHNDCTSHHGVHFDFFSCLTA